MKSDDHIAQEIKDYCKIYNISLEYFIDVISNAKVIPMIRGKSFEYSVSEMLKAILPNVLKPLCLPEVLLLNGIKACPPSSVTTSMLALEE